MLRCAVRFSDKTNHKKKKKDSLLATSATTLNMSLKEEFQTRNFSKSLDANRHSRQISKQ